MKVHVSECRDLINEESLQIVVMTRGLRLPCFSLSSRALFLSDHMYCVSLLYFTVEGA